jgi:hypothetical protein
MYKHQRCRCAVSYFLHASKQAVLAEDKECEKHLGAGSGAGTVSHVGDGHNQAHKHHCQNVTKRRATVKQGYLNFRKANKTFSHSLT